MVDGPAYRRDAPAPALRAIDRDASREHALTIMPRPRNAADERRRDAAEKAQTYIRGRLGGPRGILWDVIVVDGPGRVRVAFAGCWDWREAAAKAVDLITGRTMVSFSGAAFRLRGGLVLPSRDVRGTEATGLKDATPAAGEVVRKQVFVARPEAP